MLNDSEKLKQIRLSLDLTQLQLAEKCGVKQQVVAMVENGTRNTPDSFKLGFLKAFGVDYDTQMVDVDSMRELLLGKDNKQAKSQTNIIPIPFYSAKAAAGEGIDAPDYPEKDVMYFDKRWLQNVLGVNSENLSLITASGDSMLPLISDGDLLLVDSSIKEIINNKVFVVEDEGKFRVKRLKKEFNGDVFLISDNKQYPQEKLTHTLNIIGKVVWNGTKEIV